MIYRSIRGIRIISIIFSILFQIISIIYNGTFRKKVIDKNPLTIFRKGLITDVLQGPKYASGYTHCTHIDTHVNIAWCF